MHAKVVDIKRLDTKYGRNNLGIVQGRAALAEMLRVLELKRFPWRKQSAFW
jgi:hypothetical protein